MIRKLWVKKNYLMKLLLTIAGFLCIPLILMQFLMMEQSTIGYTKLNEKNIYEKLQMSVDTFSDLTEDLRKTAIEISQDNTIRKVAKDGCTEYTIYEGAQRLKEYNGETYSVGIWFHDNEFVLINQVRISLDELYDQISGLNQGCRQRVQEFFENDTMMEIMSTSDDDHGNQNIIVKKQVSFLTVGRKDATVFFVMPVNQLEESMRDRFHNSSSMALLDSESNYLIRGNDFTEELCRDSGFQRFIDESVNSCYVFNDGKTSAQIYKYIDFDSGYSCMVRIQEDNAETHLRSYLDGIRINLLVSIILMVVLLVLTVKINYKPILNLTNKHKGKAHNENLSELELLDSAFSMVDQKVLTQEKLLTNFIIGDLLSGKTVDGKLLEASFPDMGSNGCLVVALNGQGIDSVRANKICENLREKCGCETFVTSITYRPQILLVCIFGKNTNFDHLRTELLEVIYEVTQNTYDISFGTVVDSVLNLRSSYLRTLTLAAEKGGVELDGRIAESIQRFAEGLHTGDANTIQELLDVVESQLCAIEMTNPLRQYYCYKLLSVYFANAKEIPDAKAEMGRLIVFCDTTQLFAKMRQSVRRLCSTVNNSEQASAQKMKKKLLDYVDANFNDQSLCLMSVADYLESSIYVVSRLFKEVTGKGFKEYVTDKRLEYARDLLLTTDYTASEIASMSGIENAVRFSSVFKSKYGLPPGQYRKMYSNKDRNS